MLNTFCGFPKEDVNRLVQTLSCVKVEENLFDPSKSKTANVTDQTFNVYYGTGSVSGTLYRDYLSFGDAQTKNHIHLPEKVIFGAGEQMTISETGIFGLALADERSANNSIFWQTIKQKVFKQPMFTTFFKKCSLKEPLCENNGMVTFGDVDKKHCKPVHVWLPVIKESHLWQLKLDGFQIGDSAKTSYPVTALIDSGTSDLVISTSALDQLVRSINAQKYKGKYIVDCKKRFTFNVQIQNQTFEMTSEELMFEVGAEYCQLAVNDNSSGLWSELWILGDPFYRKFCLTHNFNGTIGVAHHRN
ncbi:Cathepsin D [Aphelenchoides bicaudatus]|nr:Cathepsin D [Aphelenchoides bicaudatus]